MSKRTPVRWLAIAAGVVALAALLLWLAAGPVIGFVVERQLRLAGVTNPSVTGASLALPDVAIHRLRLAPGDAFVLDDVRLRIGARGIVSVAVGRLRLQSGLSADGGLVLPGLALTENGGHPVDAVPTQGIRLTEGRIRLATPAGTADVSLSNLRVRRTADGADASAAYAFDHGAAHLEGAAEAGMQRDGSIRGRLDVARGRIQAGGVRATGLTGETEARVPAQGAPVISLGIESSATVLEDVALGGLALEASWRDGVAQFSVTAPDPGVLEASVSGRVALTDGARSARLSGRVLLRETPVRGELELEADVAEAADGALSGRVQVSGRDLALPDRFRQGAVEAAAEIDGRADRPRLTSTAPWTVTLTPAAALVPAAMRGLAGEAVSIAVAPRAGEPLTVRLERAQRTARLEAGVEVAAGERRLRAAGDFAADWSSDEPALAAQALELTARGLPWADLVLDVERFEGDATYAADDWRVSGGGTVEATGSLAGATYEGLRARWSGTISGTSERVVLAADECVAWSVAAVEWREAVRLERLSPPCIGPGPGGDTLLTYGFDAARARFDLSTARAPLEATVVRADGETALDGTWPAFRLSGAADAEGIERLDAGASGGAVVLTQDDVALEGIEGSLEIRGRALRSSTLSAAAIESRVAPALWVPVGLEATATGDGAGASFEAVVSDDLGVFVLEASGRYENGRGASSVTVHPLRFVSGATEVGDLSPRLAEHVTDASGEIGFEGEIAWGDDVFESGGALEIREFGATISGIAVAGVTTTAELDSLLPPATLPEQTVRIGRITAGVPLTNGLVVYDLDADGRLAIERMSFDLAGGRAYAEPFTVDSGEMGDARFVLRAEAVELSQVIESSRIEGLQGTGVLSGRVPVRVSGRRLQLDEGNLTAETDGVLRYTPEDPPDFLRGDDVRSTMLREVLTNFQYDELSVTVAGESGEGGEQRLTLSANGANPDFLDGHPIELNLDFEGPLLGAMRSAVDVSGAGGIQQMFEEREFEERESGERESGERESERQPQNGEIAP